MYCTNEYAQDEIAQELCQKWQRESENNLLLFAEYTCGHSASITDPYDDMVNTLDIRNISYASKAYEAAACWLQQPQEIIPVAVLPTTLNNTNTQKKCQHTQKHKKTCKKAYMGLDATPPLAKWGFTD